MLTTEERLETLTNLSVELNKVADLDIMMERILSEARRFTNADAGSIYIRDGDKLHFSYTQNDTLTRRLPPGGKLIYSTFSLPINENSIAGRVAHTARPLNVPDVYEMDESLPYRFGRRFDDAAGYRTQSMLTLPLQTSRNHVVGVLQIINAQDESGSIVPFSTEDDKMMRHFASTASVALERARMTRGMILRTIRMAEMRDPKETGAHVNRVAAYALEIFEAWALKNGLSKEETDRQRDILRMAAMLHDVGKVGISDTILKKPGRFTPEEYEIMKTHSVLGARLFSDRQSDFDDAALDVALNHHERWDGRGYPGHVDVKTGEPLEGFQDKDGKLVPKAGEDIPLFGRLVAISDVFDALCSRRVYKPAWSEEDALEVMSEERGKQFDPQLMDLFFSRLDVIRSIRPRYPDEEDTGQEDEKGTPNI